MSKAARAIEQNARNSVSGLGLGLSDFAVLEVLLHKGSLRVSNIEKKVLLTSGSITSAIDRLVEGLVRRTSDLADLRIRVAPRERTDLVRLLKKAGLWAAARLEDHAGHRDGAHSGYRADQ